MKRMLTLCLALLLVSPVAAQAVIRAGAQYEPFTLKTDDGNTFDSEAAVKDGALILNFMNTVCSSCMTELADMKKIMEGLRQTKFYPVSVDMRGADAVKPLKTVEATNWSYLIDPTFGLGRKYGITLTPATVVIEKGGKVAAVIYGYDETSKAELEKVIKTLK